MTDHEKSIVSSAVQAERDRITKILRGIDACELDDPFGWWETSTGADFGNNILYQINNSFIDVCDTFGLS